MKIQIQTLSPQLGTSIPMPCYATPGAAAMDLHACMEQPITIPSGGRRVIGTGLAIALPSPDYVALIYARSGLGIRHGIAPANCVGVIDSDYRGEILVGLHNAGELAHTIYPGDRIAQLMILPVLQVQLEVVDQLESTQRGTSGLGSTGLSANWNLQQESPTLIGMKGENRNVE